MGSELYGSISILWELLQIAILQTNPKLLETHIFGKTLSYFLTPNSH
ncbi:hypothetical protein LEP1GSC021_0511 [Leptospira noguchii str. 1993005606]|nr:hypothetical protein LEP1GSC021_0511 [Leptospira noguchii str. 1993005606]